MANLGLGRSQIFIVLGPGLGRRQRFVILGPGLGGV